MDHFGLSKEKIVDMLSQRGVNEGKQFSASKLREAIAEIIYENNKELEARIPDVAIKQFINEMKKAGLIKK